jgi:hypothetical protein
MLFLMDPNLLEHPIEMGHHIGDGPVHQILFVRHLAKYLMSPHLCGFHKLFSNTAPLWLQTESGKWIPDTFAKNRKVDHLNGHGRPIPTRGPTVSRHHLLHQILTSRILTGQSKSFVAGFVPLSSLWTQSPLGRKLHRSHHRSQRIMSVLLFV